MAGELPLVEEGLAPRDRWHRDRREPGGRDLLQRPGHQLGLEQARRAFEAVRPAARTLRHPRQIAPSVLLDQRDMVQGLELELGRRALGSDNLVEALVGPD